jgi:hypothetical protein
VAGAAGDAGDHGVGITMAKEHASHLMRSFQPIC